MARRRKKSSLANIKLPESEKVEYRSPLLFLSLWLGLPTILLILYAIYFQRGG